MKHSTPEERARAIEAIAGGASFEETAKNLGRSVPTISRWFVEAQTKPRAPTTQTKIQPAPTGNNGIRVTLRSGLVIEGLTLADLLLIVREVQEEEAS